MAKLDAQVAEGTRARTTADTYRQRLHSVVLPAMGQWRLRVCAVPQLDTFFTGLAATQGSQSRNTVRRVVSLILRLAVQHEAIRDNPVRHLDPIEAGSRKPRALSTEERRRFLGSSPCALPPAGAVAGPLIGAGGPPDARWACRRAARDGPPARGPSRGRGR